MRLGHLGDWCGLVWSGVVWCGLVWSGVVWCGLVWSGVVWCGLVWSGVVWAVWYDGVMAWHGIPCSLRITMQLANASSCNGSGWLPQTPPPPPPHCDRFTNTQ
jgi:hypothetical protein